MPDLRTFIAIELSQQLLGNLAGVQAELRAEIPARAVRWVRPEGIHLTLKFLGDTPVEKLDAIQAAIAQAAASTGPFSFRLAGLGCFPNTHQPRVVWVGLHEPTGALARLRDAVEREVSPLGFPSERRPFQPHLTLGRVQRGATPHEVRLVGQVLSAALPGTIGEMTVEAIAHIKSDLRPSGAVYTTLFEAILQEPSPVAGRSS
jgi:RNA 2',3'-cyclic 3'-phosphodiesterase